ncbi:Demethylmenaquinone methyltransferase [Escovopsis weberi]|uniref:Demethylmenaquinone methyltransferase n=1 Tax=Escovopsis weberi TaxID=150374 RepID=A0A0M8MRB6_ESCWE|nr:Demethylmenaquinone methyltransferase [Escovopsis weberi]
MATSAIHGQGSGLNATNLQGMAAYGVRGGGEGGGGGGGGYEDDHDSGHEEDDQMTNTDSLTSDDRTDATSSIGDRETRADSLDGVQTDSDEGDEDDNMSLDARTMSSRTATVNSSIYDHEFEGGRRHLLHMELTDGRLFNAPIEDYPQRIMDLCTGTGTWPIAVADEFPSAEIVGVDLSPIQPLLVPPNVRFILDDVEDEWIDRGGYDLIHMRNSSMFIRDIDKLVWNIYDHLKPGAWVELVDYSYEVLCDDGTMPDNYAFHRYAVLGHQAFLDYGMKPSNPDQLGEVLYRAGFQNVQSSVIKTPIGAWPEDPKAKAIGEHFRENLLGLVVAGTKTLANSGFTPAEVEVFLVSVRKSLYDTSIHSYMNLKSYWAQK